MGAAPTILVTAAATARVSVRVKRIVIIVRVRVRVRRCFFLWVLGGRGEVESVWAEESKP